MLLDFANVDYINSTGIALIVGLLAEARKTGRRCRPRGLAEHYREIFRITRLSDFMTILDDEGEADMTQETAAMEVRRAGDDIGVIEIQGDITAGSEDALMDAYARAADGAPRAVLLDFSGARVHELGWDRPARDAARARQPREAAAARLRAQRPLPPDLRADPARRGDLDLRRRGRGAGRGRLTAEGGHDDRAEHGTRRRQLGEAGRPAGGANVPDGALDTVGGKQVVSPIQGFGKMWQKTYRDLARRRRRRRRSEVIAIWKAEFPTFWPKGSQFHAPLTGIAPGEVALLQASVGGGMKLSTGVFVLYADEESFTFMTPQGHMFAGWITFSLRPRRTA